MDHRNRPVDLLAMASKGHVSVEALEGRGPGKRKEKG
jgi:hypothetical protein